jgi:hypothetical protein
MNTFRLLRRLAATLGLITLVLAGLAATVSPANAFNFAPAGPEFQVHTQIVGAQVRPDVAMDANGNSVVVWGSATYSLATSGVFAQRFDSNWNPVGGEFKVNGTGGSKVSVAMAPDGRFVIAWDEGHEIVAKRYDANGNPLPPPAGVLTGSTWGIGNEFIVKTGPPFGNTLPFGGGVSRHRAEVAVDHDGNFIIAWEDKTGADGSDWGVFAKRYDAAGNELVPPAGVPAGSDNEFRVNSYTQGLQLVPGVAMASDGGFIITWFSLGQDGGLCGVFAKRYDKAGVELAPPAAVQGSGIGNEFQVNTHDQAYQVGPSGDEVQHKAPVTVASDGSFVIAWTSAAAGAGSIGQDCSSVGVFAKRYDPAGNELTPVAGTQGNGIGNEFQVNSRGEQFQGAPDLAMTQDGHFVVTWYGYAGQPTGRVVAKAYTSDGQVITPPEGSQGNGLCNEFEATTFTAEGVPAVAIAPSGSFIIVWDDWTGADGDFSGPGAPTGIFARRYVGVPGPTPVSPLTNEPVIHCPADFTVNVDGLGQAVVPDLRFQAVITGVCAPCAAVSITQSPAPGAVVNCGAHPITLTLSDTAGHTAGCTTMFNVINPAGSVNVVLKVVDQHGQEIPGSQINVLSQTINTGDSLLVPEGTHVFLVMPGLRGAVGNTTELFRTDTRAVTCTTTELLFEWITSTYSVRIKDQHGVDIPASHYTTAGPSVGVTCGDPVTLPITDESVYPTMAGGYKDGYFASLFPGLRGAPTSSELYRYAEGPLELSAVPAEFVFEWITSTYTVRIVDQHGVDIPVSKFQTAGPSAGIDAGDPVTLPITDESVYPKLNGGYKDGYFANLFPGLRGAPNTGEIYRYNEGPLELSAAPAEFVFEWIQHQCALEVRDAANAPVPGSHLINLPYNFPAFVPGQPMPILVNDSATYPTIQGGYASFNYGYPITVIPGDIAPTSATINFTVCASGGISPGAFTIGGNSYSLALACGGDCETPAIAGLTAPSAPLALSTAATVTAHFAAADNDSGRVCAFDWGDGSSDSGLDASAAACAASHTYASPGVYRVTVTSTNDCGATATAVHEFVVVYDPEGGFVTGGGWINSPAGAYAADPSLTGKANFGFVAKYQQGANVPTGSTEFQFKAGDLNFKSTSYEWLVVAGAKAKFKGGGTINGSGDYIFQLTATDGRANGGGGTDRFRIKIWDPSGGGVIYDNQPGAADDADATTALGGGSIVIHKP